MLAVPPVRYTIHSKMRLVSSFGMAVFVAATAAASVEGFHVPQSQTSRTASTTSTSRLQNTVDNNNSDDLSVSSRREMLFGTATAAALGALGVVAPSPVWASGGATAGKYTYVQHSPTSNGFGFLFSILAPFFSCCY